MDHAPLNESTGGLLPCSGDGPDAALARAVSPASIEAAGRVLAGVAHRTPVVTSRTLDGLVGARVFLKCEQFQRVGAFKFRGAYAAMATLDGAARGRGVLTYSSGNHAQAVACAAGLLGVRAVIVMPADAPRIKLDATRGYLAGAPAGSRIVTYDRGREVREAVGGAIARAEGLTIVPPYDDPAVIAGQGTAAWELFGEVGELDWLFVPCGGGGLLSGSAVAARGRSPGCRVVGVEPCAGDDAARSFASGRLCTVDNPQTIADGARTPCLGRHTFALVMAHVSELVTVGDGAIASALRLVSERLKLVIEPTAALGVAGLIELARQRPEDVTGGRVGVILTGGNVDLDQLGSILGMAGCD